MTKTDSVTGERTAARVRIANIYGTHNDLHHGSAVHPACDKQYKAQFGTYPAPPLSAVLWEGCDYAHTLNCYACGKPIA